MGRGRVGRGLAAALRRSAEVRVSLASGRRPTRGVARADVIILAVPDAAIASTAATISAWIGPGTVVVHCAGARGPGELDACKRAGAAVGVLHPMVSFPSPTRPPSLRGTTLVVDGDAQAVRCARRLGRAMGARVVVAPVHGPAYHAAAALAANGSAALATAAVGLLERLGLQRRAAERTVGGLLRTVADNVERIGVPDALTGPVRRGDADTVRAHRQALRRLDGAVLRAYDAVAPVILECARAAGLSADRARRVRRALAEGRSTGKSAPK